MLKKDELLEVDSSWNKAKPDERVFVLLARDAAAPETIRFWAHHRVALGKNKPDDPQILEAGLCADLMEGEPVLVKGDLCPKCTMSHEPGPCHASAQRTVPCADPNDGSIGYALSQLRAGKQVRRSCWHHRHVYLEMSGPNITLHSHGQKKEVWCANQDDLLADDWVVEKADDSMELMAQPLTTIEQCQQWPGPGYKSKRQVQPEIDLPGDDGRFPATTERDPTGNTGGDGDLTSVRLDDIVAKAADDTHAAWSQVWASETKPSTADLHAMKSGTTAGSSIWRNGVRPPGVIPNRPAALYDDEMVRGLAKAALKLSTLGAVTDIGEYRQMCDALDLARKIGLVK